MCNSYQINAQLNIKSDGNSILINGGHPLYMQARFKLYALINHIHKVSDYSTKPCAKRQTELVIWTFSVCWLIHGFHRGKKKQDTLTNIYLLKSRKFIVPNVSNKNLIWFVPCWGSVSNNEWIVHKCSCHVCLMNMSQAVVNLLPFCVWPCFDKIASSNLEWDRKDLM